MPQEFKPGCQRPAIKKALPPTQDDSGIPVPKEEKTQMIKVGKPAPNFTAAAYHEGKFMNISLDEYKGQWVVLCFYPGDFTFV